MKLYELKQKELKEIAEEEAHKIAGELIFKNRGKTIQDLQRDVLRFIHEHDVPEGISFKLKLKIEGYISSLVIPVQEN